MLEELENTKMELSQSRRRTEEAERDAEISRKKLSSVRDDSVRDLMMDYENSQRAQVELQDLCKHQKLSFIYKYFIFLHIICALIF